MHHSGGKASHGDAFAAALGVPNHTAFASARGLVGAGCRHHMFNGCTYRVKLVVARHFFHQMAVIFEQHKKTQVVEQIGRSQHATNQGFQLLEFAQWVQRNTINGAPLHVALFIAGQRAHAGFGAIRDDQQGVVGEDIGDLRFVGLNLVVGLPNVGVEVGWVFQFNQHQRQAIDEQQDVGPARVARPLDGELLHRQPLVALGVLPIDQAHQIAPRLAVLLILHRHTRHQHAVKCAVA